MSRWIIPFWWACWIAWQTGTNSSSRCFRDSCRSSQYSVIGTPLTSSMTKKGRPDLLTGVEHAGDVGVVHQGQRLAFGIEPGQDGAAVHAGLDDLDGDHPPYRRGLLGHPDAAHATLADLLDELVLTRQHRPAPSAGPAVGACAGDLGAGGDGWRPRFGS